MSIHNSQLIDAHDLDGFRGSEHSCTHDVMILKLGLVTLEFLSLLLSFIFWNILSGFAPGLVPSCLNLFGSVLLPWVGLLDIPCHLQIFMYWPGNRASLERSPATPRYLSASKSCLEWMLAACFDSIPVRFALAFSLTTTAPTGIEGELDHTTPPRYRCCFCCVFLFARVGFLIWLARHVRMCVQRFRSCASSTRKTTVAGKSEPLPST
jgi:hypothetical protein